MMSSSCLARFRRETAGGVSVLFVLLLPFLLFCVALGIDLARLNAQKQYVQAQADLAALSAIRNFDTANMARAAARDTIARNTGYDTRSVRDEDIVFGRREGQRGFRPSPDQGTTRGADAARVVVSSGVDFYLIDLFMPDDDPMAVTREAVAARIEPRVSFALSNCLLNVRLLNGILRPLIGADVDVLCSGHGIEARVDLMALLQDYSAEGSLLTPGGAPRTYGDLLNAGLPVGTLLSDLLGRPVPAGRAIRLGDAVRLSPDLAELEIGQPLPPLLIDPGTLIFASAELLAEHVAEVETRLDLGPFGTVAARVVVSEPRQIVLGAVPGAPDAVASTSQIRVDIDRLRIGTVVDLSLSVHVANAAAHLSDRGDTCGTAPRTVVALFDPVDVSLLRTGVSLSLVGVPADQEEVARREAAAAEPETQQVGITFAQYVAGTPVGVEPRISGAALTRGLTRSVGLLLRDGAAALDEASGCRSLTCLVTSLAARIATIVVSATITADSLINVVGSEGTAVNGLFDDLLGLGFARAELELLDIHCDYRLTF